MEALTRKVGGLPVWAWAAIALVGYWAYRKYSAAQAANASTTAAQNVLANAYGNITGAPYAGYQSGASSPGQGAAGTSPGSGAGTPGTATPTPTATNTVAAGTACTCPGSSSSAAYPSTTDANGNCQCAGGNATNPVTGGGSFTGPASPGNTPGASVGGLSSAGQYVTAQTGVSYTQVPAGTPGAQQFTGSSTWYKAG